MRSKPVAIVLVIVILGAMFLASCGTSSPSPAPEGDLLHLLVAAEGPVTLKREGWTEYIPVAFGVELHPTDLLQVQGEAVVLCANLEVKSISGEGRCPCSSDRGVLVYRGASFGAARGITSVIPYTLYPRNTLILDPYPLLRWHDTGATSYTVAIVQGGKTIWSEADVVDNQVRYPDDAPALQSGVDYLLVVTDNVSKRISTEDPAKGLGFQIVEEADRQQIAARRTDILALSSIDEPARNLALAVYYAGLEFPGGDRRLWGEALLLLDQVCAVHDSPAVQLRRGRALAAMKLDDEAIDAYQSALRNAETLGDLESQATAHVGLCQMGNQSHLPLAIQLYERLGDNAQATTLREHGCK